MKPYIAIPLITLGVLAADCGLLLAQGRGRGNQTPTIRQLAWVDRGGDVQGTVGPRMSSILDPSISPDGAQVAVRGREVQGETDHLYILEGTAATRLTSNEGFERHMIWSPDGSRIAYSIQDPGGVSNLYIRASDGSGSDQPLIESEGMHNSTRPALTTCRFRSSYVHARVAERAACGSAIPSTNSTAIGTDFPCRTSPSSSCRNVST